MKKDIISRLIIRKTIFPVDLTEQFMVLSQSNRSPPLTWIMNTLHKGDDRFKT